MSGQQGELKRTITPETFEMLKERIARGESLTSIVKNSSFASNTVYKVRDSSSFEDYKSHKWPARPAGNRPKPSVESATMIAASTESRTIVDLRIAKAQAMAQFDAVINHLTRLNGGR